MSNEIAQPSVLDRVEARIVELGGEVRVRGTDGSFAPLRHHFTPGLYAREIFMPTGLVLTSETHKTEHPFIVSHGRCLVWNETTRVWDVIQAPYFGITQPGTRRFIIVVFDTIWTTFHVTAKTDVAEIENEILADRLVSIEVGEVPQ